MSARAKTARSAVAVLGLVVIAAVCAALANWQYRRAGESRTSAARFAAAAEAPALTRPPAVVSDDVRFKRLTVRGRYEPSRQFLLDDRIHDGVAGYEVLTPFRLEAGPPLLLVNRGWVPTGPDRRVLPDVSVHTEDRTLTGRIDRLPRPGLRVGASTPPGVAEPVAVVLYPSAAELAAQLGEPVFDYELLLDPEAPDGFVRDWRAPGLDPSRHLAYAGQWLVFGLIAFGAAVAIAAKAAKGHT